MRNVSFIEIIISFNIIIQLAINGVIGIVITKITTRRGTKEFYSMIYSCIPFDSFEGRKVTLKAY